MKRIEVQKYEEIPETIVRECEEKYNEIISKGYGCIVSLREAYFSAINFDNGTIQVNSIIIIEKGRTQKRYSFYLNYNYFHPSNFCQNACDLQERFYVI